MVRRNGPIGLTGPTRSRANLCRRVFTPLPSDADRADPGGHRRGRPDRLVGLARPPPAAEGPRSAGRPRSGPQGTAAEGSSAHRLRPRPLGHDHAEPRRQARRLRAAHPEAGLERDRDPARGRARPGGRGEADRLDGEARALRPRAGARSALGRRRPARRSRRRASTTCSRASRRRRRTARRASTRCSRRRPRRRAPGRTRRPTTTWHRIGGPTASLHRDPTTGNPGLLDPYRGKVPKDAKVLPVPAKTVVITCTAASSVGLPG